MKSKDKKSGVQLPEWLPPIIKAVAPMGRMQVKDAYTEGMIDWLRKTADANNAVKVYLHQESAKNAEVRSVLFPDSPSKKRA